MARTNLTPIEKFAWAILFLLLIGMCIGNFISLGRQAILIDIFLMLVYIICGSIWMLFRPKGTKLSLDPPMPPADPKPVSLFDVTPDPELQVRIDELGAIFVEKVAEPRRIVKVVENDWDEDMKKWARDRGFDPPPEEDGSW